MKIEVRNSCADFQSYRAARVKSLFNCESGANFNLDADLGIDDAGWKLGVVVGPSGSGKTSIGRSLWGGDAFWAPEWPDGEPIVDAIARGGDFDAVTAALSQVGLGNVPSWLRPHAALSNGEKFRADLARLVCEAPARVVVDEFTSVVDRQIAQIGAGAFAKSWRRTDGQAVLLSCHYDILDWLQPDWVFDTASGEFHRGRWHRPRPTIDLEIQETDWSWWPIFAPHHYLKAGPMIGAQCYVGTVNGEPVVHLGVGTKNVGKVTEARACRLVTMPEWQGAGVGLRFLETICDMQLRGENPLRRQMTTVFHTSHPGLCTILRNRAGWRQLSAVLHGSSRTKCAASISKSGGINSGYGGHFRAVQGFRYYGKERVPARTRG